MNRKNAYRRIGSLRDVGAFREYLAALGLEIPVDARVLRAAEDSPLARPWKIGNKTLMNRWTIHPMEGWDGNADGSPSELVLHRWRKFGLSGAKMIFGGEAFAVAEDGRANPRQLCFHPRHGDDSCQMLADTVRAAHEEYQKSAGESGTTAGDFVIGLQLTHSGRFSQSADGKYAPRIAQHHPALDARVGISPADDACIMTDDDIQRLIEKYVATAKAAHRAGFDFVDVKHCHGYFAHELLHAVQRPGRFGGALENRMRFAREIIAGVRAECPGMMIGVRLSLFDALPGETSKAAPGAVADFVKLLTPEDYEIVRVFAQELKIDVLNLTAGSPYYSVYVQRPSFTPAVEAVLGEDGVMRIPTDITPPEDPLIGCCRQMVAVRDVKRRFPELPIIGSAYSYFQEFLPHVAQAVVREGWADSVGIGRMVLPYWDFVADTLAGRALDKRRICRTFSDCTTGPRNGMVSGCYPLDAEYKCMAEALKLREMKKKGTENGG